MKLLVCQAVDASPSWVRAASSECCGLPSGANSAASWIEIGLLAT